MAGDQIKHKTGIKYKVILIICLSTMVVMSLGITLGYLFGFNLLRDMVGDIHRKLSQLLAGEITRKFEDQMDSISRFAAEPLWKEAVIKSDLKYEPSAADVPAKDYLARMNAAWIKSDRESPLVKEYVDSGVGNRLKAIVDGDDNIAGITVIDKFGGLVAASGKTDRFYFADDEWRRKFFSDGKRGALIGDIEFDKALKKWVIPTYLSIRDTDGALLGVFKTELSVKNLFSSLGNFKVDNTGHASVIDGRGNIMFHPGVTQTDVKLCSDKDYSRLLTSKGKYAVVHDLNIHKKRIFAAFSEVVSPVLSGDKKVWRVLVEQDAKEVFAPLARVAPWLVVAVVFLLIAMVVTGFFFSGVLVKPIEALYAAAVQIRKGNWDYKIDIRTGDEIEQFADAFKDMISNIKSKQQELLKAKGDLEKLSNNLEEKVQARTVDLTMAKDKINDYTKELEKAIIVKSDFVSMASHELRTPLAAIKEGISIVLAEKTGAITSQQKEFLDMAKRNLDRLERLINDILDFQKLDRDKMAIKIYDDDINEVAKEVCQMMDHLAKEKGLTLTAELSGDIPKVKFDKDKIAQVLINLIGNSIKFTQKGSVKVSTKREGNAVKVSVRDTGIGIREEDLPQLFQKFTQLEKGLERTPGGTGLGLTISKEIIKKHGGKIWAESKFGEGTTFYFILPVEERRNYS